MTVSRVVVAGVASAALLTACAQSTDGAAETESTSAVPSAASTVTSATGSAPPPTSSEPVPDGFPAFGVVETTRRPLEPGEWVCAPPAPAPGAREATFTPPGPGAPQITIALPDTWNSVAAQDGSQLVMTGPDDLTGTVTVMPTELDAAAAFEKYSDEQTADAPISSISVLPAELCGFSGQKMLGMLSGGASPPVEYLDRIAHVWTAGPAYLVAIHVQGPQGGDAVSEAADVILEDFGIRIP